jgi:hypothetical protein
MQARKRGSLSCRILRMVGLWGRAVAGNLTSPGLGTLGTLGDFGISSVHHS